MSEEHRDPCPRGFHEWLPFEDGPLPTEGYPPVPDYECQVCQAVGDECPDCGGTGFTDWEDETDGDDELLDDGVCDNCDGRGVIERKEVAR